MGMCCCCFFFNWLPVRPQYAYLTGNLKLRLYIDWIVCPPNPRDPRIFCLVSLDKHNRDCLKVYNQKCYMCMFGIKRKNKSVKT